MRPIPQYPNGHFVSTYPWFCRIQLKNPAYGHSIPYGHFVATYSFAATLSPRLLI